ncbi:MAG: prolyl oligopeptidase family serine peptidase [Deltaproteobacteria bacterium]|nr:prolyl oligopeptidase family serine peptidase [Deltaproteobacteria bacterium]
MGPLASTPIAVPLDGGAVVLRGAIFRPPSPSPVTGHPVVVWNHQSPLTVDERAKMTPHDPPGAIAWFVERGYAVVSVLRRGFGVSGGRFDEGVGRDARYAKAGRAAGRDIRAVLEHLRQVDDVDRDRVVLAGHSAGGFGALAVLDDEPVAAVRVRLVLDFAGGKGAQWLRQGPHFEDTLVAAAGELGRRSRTPTAWIYAANDLWFPPPIVDRMHAAYRAAGAPAELVRLPAVGEDGHELFTDAAIALWTDAVEHFLRVHLP